MVLLAVAGVKGVLYAATTVEVSRMFWALSMNGQNPTASEWDKQKRIQSLFRSESEPDFENNTIHVKGC